jgi:Domain of unknown function (DUF4331)
MSHHLSGLGVSPISSDGRSHITDLFVFQKPGDANKTIIILDVNPVLSTTDGAVDPGAVYEIDIDSDADAVADAALRVRFSPALDGSQTAEVQLARGRAAAADVNAGEIIIRDAPVSTGAEPRITTGGEYRVFTGVRSDPFFADFAGAQNNFQWTGEDYFAEKDIFGIVLEVPNSTLGPSPQVGIWARVVVTHEGSLVQSDRVGRPAIDFVFNANDDDKRVWNQQAPKDDTKGFQSKFAGVFEQAGHPRDEAEQLAAQLLPDILTYDYTSGAGYLNGRKLTDDVINMGLAMLTGGKVPHDGLRPHGDLLPDFPYLGGPHEAAVTGKALGVGEPARPQ